MKTAYCDTLKNGQFQCKFIPQKSLHLIKYTDYEFIRNGVNFN